MMALLPFLCRKTEINHLHTEICGTKIEQSDERETSPVHQKPRAST